MYSIIFMLSATLWDRIVFGGNEGGRLNNLSKDTEQIKGGTWIWTRYSDSRAHSHTLSCFVRMLSEKKSKALVHVQLSDVRY